MITVRSLQCNPALVLKWNAGNCKADTVFCTVALICKQYIKLCAADAAEKQQQCAEDQKRPIAGECGNNSHS